MASGVNRPGMLSIGRMIVLALATLAAGQSAKAEDQFLFELENVRWQRWAPKIGRPMAGPDGRLWVIQDHRDPTNLEKARQEIVNQFGRQQPRLRWARPILFEASGRVWFVLEGEPRRGDGRAVVAYDGKQLIEKRMRGGAPGRAGIVSLPEAGILAFVAGRTVFILEGKNWTQRELESETDTYWRLTPEPDGAGFVAYPQWNNINAVLRKKYARCWRWREGNWSSIEVASRLPRTPYVGFNQDPATAPPAEVHLAFVLEGKLFLYARGQLTQVPLEPPSSEQLARLIRQLGAEAFEARDQAMQKLVEFGPAVEDQLRQAMDKTNDAEIRHRLRMVVEHDLDGVDLRPTLGGLRLGLIYALDVDERGNVCALVRTGPKDEPNSSALVVVEPDGQGHVLSGEQLGPEWKVWNVEWRMWHVHAGAKARQIWIDGTENYPALLVDLETDQVLHRMDVVGAGSIDAVLPDGTVICYDRIAYRPDAPESTALPIEEEFRIHSALAWDIAADTGDIWAADERGQIHRYDGKRWYRLERQPPAAYASAIWKCEHLLVWCGRDNTVLLVFAVDGRDNRYQTGFYDGQQFHMSTDVPTLLQKHQKQISKAFAECSEPHLPFWPAIMVDARGRIWYALTRNEDDHEDQLKVLVDGQWIDLIGKHPLLADPMADLQVRPVGRDGEVLITSQKIQTEAPGKYDRYGLLVSWENGQPRFTPGPQFPIHDGWFVLSEEATWLGVVRFAEGRKPKPVKWKTVHFMDPDGCAWGFGRSSIFRMRGEQVVQEMPMNHELKRPWAEVMPGAAWFDSRGNAYIAMKYGIQRFDRKPDDQESMYEPSMFYLVDTRLEPLDSIVRASQSHGLMVFSGPSASPSDHPAWLKIVDLKKIANADR